MIVRVRDIKFIFEKCQTARLKKLRGGKSAVCRAVRSGSGQSPARFFPRVDDFDFGIVSVGDVQNPAGESDSKWVLQPRGLVPAVFIAEFEKIFANNRFYFSIKFIRRVVWRKIRHPNG